VRGSQAETLQEFGNPLSPKRQSRKQTCSAHIFLSTTDLNMTTSAAALKVSLEQHNDTFESLLKLIPAKHYLVRDPDGEEASYFLLVQKPYKTNQFMSDPFLV
jgi:hypothetical protein